MLIFKFIKACEAAFLPHLDTLRMIIRTIRRAGICVKYSEGFNPHMNLYMSPPIPLGVESLCEYCAVDTDMNAEEFLQRYNNNCNKNIACVKALNVSKNPNLAACVTAAKYEIKSPYLIENFDNIHFDNIKVKTLKDGKETLKEAKDGIIKIEKTLEGIAATLKFGNSGNLRADKFTEAIKEDTGNFSYSIIKTECYCKDITADGYIKRFI